MGSHFCRRWKNKGNNSFIGRKSHALMLVMKLLMHLGSTYVAIDAFSSLSYIISIDLSRNCIYCH